MSRQAAATAATQLAAYDRAAAYAILRDWTPRRMEAELRAGRLGAQLSADEAAELERHLTAWTQRALAELPLRDALLVDERRGRRVFALVCADLTAARAPVAAELGALLPEPPADVGRLPAALAAEPALAALIASATRDGLTLVAQTRPDDYPFPENLDALLPPLPRGRHQEPPFEQPTGWRRRLAALLAAVGVVTLGGPMLLGRIPEHPAGLPLALITLALLVGIRAGWAGYGGSLCIWMVANLPGFRHGTDLRSLWPALPLLAAGLVLLSRDRRVRMMWGWIRGRVAGVFSPRP